MVQKETKDKREHREIRYLQVCASDAQSTKMRLLHHQEELSLGSIGHSFLLRIVKCQNGKLRKVAYGVWKLLFVASLQD